MDLKESYFDTGELKLHFVEGPEAGPPLVLLHGATGNCGEWLAFFPHLAQKWHLYALDLRGHGLSGRPETLEGYNLSHNIRDTAVFLREKVREPAVLLGHSYGAVTALLTVMDAPDNVRAIVLEDPPLTLRRDAEESKSYLDYFAMVYQMRQTAKTVAEITALLSAENEQVPVEFLQPWAQSLAWLDPNFALALFTGNKRETARDIDFEAHIRAIHCPTLLLQADPTRGGALLPADLDFFMANIPDPARVKLVTFPGSGHGIHNEQPAAFLQAFDEFSARLA